jgi:hypothetical protein
MVTVQPAPLKNAGMKAGMAALKGRSTVHKVTLFDSCCTVTGPSRCESFLFNSTIADECAEFGEQKEGK